MVETRETALISGSSRRWRHRAALTASLLLVAGTVLTGCDGGIVKPTGSTGQPSVGASQSPGAPSPAGPTPVGEGGAWTSIESVAAAPEATLRAARTDAAGVFVDTTFVLTATGATLAATLAARLASTPAAPFKVGAGPGAGSVTLRPERPLAAGQSYRFDLSGSDGLRTASWAFQVRGPIHVQSTIPGDTATAVPTTTGIEVAFDQDGVADISPYFTISPATEGRFERNGRTQVFVPFGLKARTVYTVTVRKGLPGVAPGLALERDLRFRFETSGPPVAEPIRIRIGRDILQASPTERPVFGLEVILPDVDGVTRDPPRSVPVRVYRYPSGDAAIRQLRLLFDQPAFAEWSEPKVPTSGLPRVLSFSARLRMVENGGVIAFPTRLPAGWYLVEVGSAPRSQAILQVTSVAAWVAVLSDRTVVWANDAVTGRPVSRAVVRLHDGATLGRTDATGLLIARTPTALLPADAIPDDKSGSTPTPTPTSPILDVRAPNGTSVSVPFDVNDRGGTYRGEWAGYEPATSPGWWSLLSTDRELYRTTDTVDVLGLLRTRLERTVPTTVELRLVTSANDQVTDPPVITRISVHPDLAGAFSGSLLLDGQAVGTYILQAVVDGTVARRAMVQVGVIRKPLYELGVTLDHHAVVQAPNVGSAPASDEGRIAATITARFFDGRPVPTVPLRVVNDYEDTSGTRTVTGPTDANGQVVYAWSPAREESSEGEGDVCISISPARTEEGEIQASSCALVFPSAVTLRAEGTLAGRRLSLSGDVHLVDLAGVERQLVAGMAEGASLRIDGPPVARTPVTATVTELIPVRHLAGYLYDPITKQVLPRYDYDTTRRPLRTLTLRTGADGRFRTSLAVPSAKHEYEIVLQAVDGLGRIERHTVDAGPAIAGVSEPAARLPQFETIVGEREVAASYDVGDAVRLTMTDGVRALPSGGSNRYLYIVARQGLRSVKVTTSSRFDRHFAEGDVPGIFVIGVRFTGRTYAPKAAAWADFDPANRRITVSLTADRSRYAPGGTANVAIRTTDARGRPVAASVILRAVDQKLFSMGAAVPFEPLPVLYEREPSGILRLTATHQAPGGGTEGEGGAAGGGGGDEGLRNDFVDALAFRQVLTDRAGRATVALPLSDDLTSWHLSATAVTSALGAGEGDLLLPVGLPFFVEATIADEYLVADRPMIRLRAYGDGLATGDPVTFTVSGASLGLAPTRYPGRAFTDVDVPLPPLVVGRHPLVIEATSTRTGPDGRPLSDRLARTVTVVTSRLTSIATDWRVLTTAGRLPGGADLTTYTFSDAGRGRYISLLEELASEGGARIDRALAQVMARDLLVRTFGRDPASLPPAAFDPSIYQTATREDDNGNPVAAGVPLLPYSGPDPMLTARIAIVAPDRLDPDGLRDLLLVIDGLPTTSRELHLAVTAGLASLGVPRLAEVRAAAALPDLTVRERLYVALGAEASGDDETARSIEGDLLRSYGERLGDWARLRTGSTADEMVDLTSLCALVAAGLGDPLAPALLDYVRANPARTELHSLDEVGVVERALPRTPSAADSFAYTLDGGRHVVDLPAGGSFGLDLTAAQRDAIRLETLTGSVGVAASWTAPVAPADLRLDPDLGLTRSVTPAGTIPADTVVVVELRPTFGGTAVDGCYDVVETVPSGLAPLTRTDALVGDDGSVSPYAVVGQEVRFCADRATNPKTPLVLRYLARVITPGTYAWEPAVMRFAEAPGGVAFVPAGSVGIGSR